MEGVFGSPFGGPNGPQANLPRLVAGIAADGSVQFPAVPEGTYGALVSCGNYVFRKGPSQVEVGAADLGDLVWKVAKGAQLTVRFVDDAERPVASARGRLVYPARHGAPRMMAPLLANAKGVYEHQGALYPGVYTIEPETGYEGDSLDVELRDGPTEATFHLRGRGNLLVTVETPRGEPIDDVTVYAIGRGGSVGNSGKAAAGPAARATPPGPGAGELRTEAVALGEGRFRVSPLSSGRFELHASDGINAPFPTGAESNAGGAANLVEVHPGSDVEVSITLDRNVSIRGGVVDASQRPLPDVWVRARCEPPNSNMPTMRGPVFEPPGRRRVSGEDGRFNLDGLAPTAVCSVEAERPAG